MSSPSSITPQCWEQLSNIKLNPGTYSYMTCHWTDVERGLVVPKFSGQIFYFADIDGMWVYIEPEPERRKVDWASAAIFILFLVCLLLLCLMVANVIKRTGWPS